MWTYHVNCGYTLLIVSMTSTVLYSCRLIPWHLLNRRVCMSELQIDFLWQWVEIQFCNLKQSTIIWFVYNMRFISNTWKIMRDLLVFKMRKIMTEEFLIRLAANLLIIGRNGANSKFFLEHLISNSKDIETTNDWCLCGSARWSHPLKIKSAAFWCYNHGIFAADERTDGLHV